MASPSEYVTYRKPYRSSSLTNLSNVTNSSEKAIFDATMMSIPDSLHDNSDIISDLNEQIKKLTTQLSSAHNEIENLNTENFRLKTDLQKMIKSTNTFKKICSTPCRKTLSPIHKVKTPFQNKEPSWRSIKETIINDLQNNRPETTPIMHSKETQTTFTSSKLEKAASATKILYDNDKEKASLIKKPRQKNNLCILSSYATKGSLSTLQEVYSNYSHFCHYIRSNSSATDLIRDIELKVKSFTLKDYCIIHIGENDIKEERDYIDIINKLRTSLQKINHTNIIICAATYVAGAPIYNFKVEMFNNLLYLDIQSNEYAYFFDTNRDLSPEMFSHKTGKITNYGMKIIHDRIVYNMLLDLDIFYQADKETINSKPEDNVSINLTNQPTKTQELNYSQRNNKNAGIINTSEETSNQFFLQSADH